jgi:hypothetical protein
VDLTVVAKEFDTFFSRQADIYQYHRSRLLAVASEHSFTRCQYRPMFYNSTMKPSGLPLAFACVNPTNVLVAPRLTHAVFMGFPADAAPADSLAIITSLTRAGVPATKEPNGLIRADGKRPDGLTLVPWREAETVTWDVAVADTVAESYTFQ